MSSDQPLSISMAGNTMIPSLHAIVSKGYSITLWYISEGNGDLLPQYDAERDGRLFSATSPEELLGLIAMWEVRGDDWQLQVGEEDFLNQLLDAAIVYDSDGNVIEV